MLAAVASHYYLQKYRRMPQTSEVATGRTQEDAANLVGVARDLGVSGFGVYSTLRGRSGRRQKAGERTIF